MDRLYPLAAGQTPNLDERRAGIDYSSAADFGGVTDFFIVACYGELIIPAAGNYGFTAGMRVPVHQGLEGGVMRLAWGPDGALNVGCIGDAGNWSWKGFGPPRLGTC